MSHLVAHAQKIKKLTLSKQHIASIAWELDLYSMQTLSAGAYRVWHLIRAYAAFDTKYYSTKISQEHIAEILKCSVKTINRAISEIKEAKLIEVQNNVSHVYGTQANTYFITFPEEIYEKTEALPDKAIKFSIEITDDSSKDRAMPSPAAIPQSKTEINSTSTTTMSSALPVSTFLPKTIDAGDKSDVTPPVKNDLHISDYNYIEKNNRGTEKLEEISVVFDDIKYQEEEKQLMLVEQQEKLTALLDELNNKKQKLQAELAEYRPLTSTSDRISMLKNILKNRIDPNIQKSNEQSSHLLKQLDEVDIKINQLSKQMEYVKIDLTKQQKIQAVYSDPYFVNRLAGERQLSDQEIQFIQTKLNTLNLSKETKNKLTNEVIYEARFGSLVKNNQTHDQNPIKRSINIGCKLIKTGQWCKPTNFDQKCLFSA